MTLRLPPGVTMTVLPLDGTMHSVSTAYFKGKVIRSQLGPFGQQELDDAYAAATAPPVVMKDKVPLFNNAVPRARRGRKAGVPKDGVFQLPDEGDDE